MKELYEMVFKRKSIRKFDETLALTENELIGIKEKTEKLISLREDIEIKFEIVERERTTAKRGKYCLVMYSEKKPNYLINAGYLLEQLDLFLASKDIGVCWYGLAKPKEMQIGDLEYVIMLAFGKGRPQDFRQRGSKFNRKSIEEIWKGEFDFDAKEVVRIAPSACNTQPWRIVSQGDNIKVYRNTKIKSFIPVSKLPYYNSIDLGICLCFLEIAMLQKGYEFERTLITDGVLESGLLEVAVYDIKSSFNN